MTATPTTVLSALGRLGPSTAPAVTDHVNRLGPEASIGDVALVLEQLEAVGRVHKTNVDRDGWAVVMLSAPHN